jgi:hypothetical protein
MTIKPNFQTYEYDPKKVIKVKNPMKQKLYIAFGLFPCDIYVDSNGDLIMLFEKSVLS